MMIYVKYVWAVDLQWGWVFLLVFQKTSLLYMWNFSSFHRISSTLYDVLQKLKHSVLDWAARFYVIKLHNEMQIENHDVNESKTGIIIIRVIQFLCVGILKYISFLVLAVINVTDFAVAPLPGYYFAVLLMMTFLRGHLWSFLCL